MLDTLLHKSEIHSAVFSDSDGFHLATLNRGNIKARSDVPTHRVSTHN